MAKYGMSMCVLGMSEEFRSEGIAVNALWPRTTIATAAIEFNFPGAVLAASRHPAIVADAARHILTRNSRECSGNFFVDEEVLRAAGIEDFSRYAVSPGDAVVQRSFSGLKAFMPHDAGQIIKPEQAVTLHGLFLERAARTPDSDRLPLFRHPPQCMAGAGLAADAGADRGGGPADCCGDSRTAEGAFAGCGVTEAAQRACADRLDHWKTTNAPTSRSMTSIATRLRFILPL